MSSEKTKEKEPKMEKFFSESILKKLLGTREKRVEFLYTIILIVITIAVFVIYGYGLLSSFLAFMISSIMLGTRIAGYIVAKWDDPVWEQKGGRKRAMFVVQYIVIAWGVVMMYNLIYDFRLWYILGVVDRWIDEVAISFNSIMASLIILGIYVVWLEFENLERIETSVKGKEVGKSAKTFMIMIYVLTLIVVPAILMVAFVKFYEEIDLATHGGVLQDTTYSGQGIDDWFAYVFYILFQAPVPAFMIAFMAIASVGVIMAQNLANVGRVISGVAMGIVAIVPLLIVFATIGGSIPPPQELVDVIGLSPSIASFIYGMGLIITYVVSVSIMGVFIASSRALIMDFG
jgi:hypothetical protein